MSEHTPPPVSPARWLLAVAVVVLAAVALWLLPTTSTNETASSAADESSSMLAVAPGGSIELTSLPEDQQVLYQAAAADHEAFEAVTCYCGCEAFLDHRHLLDCFERPSGGWERHARGCAVCLAEARDVIEMRDDGVPIEQIVRTIDDRFGGITDTTTA